MTKRAAIYARISQKDKKTPKVENQIDICKALAEDHGYEVVSIFKDDGIAASGRLIDDTTLSNRPGARDLLDAMRRRDFDVLLAVEGERLARTYLDGLEFIRASAAGSVTWHLDGETPLDPSTPTGEEIAVSIFASGRREGRVRDARQKRRYDRERANGTPLWGTRPFGYEMDRISLRPKESKLIADAVADYLAGTRSMVRIAHDWTDAGVLTDGMQKERKGRDGVTRPARQQWSATTVRQVLQRDRNAGIFMHAGTRMAHSKIEPIITEEQLEALRARVKGGTPVGARAETLLGGVLRCECGAPMHSTTSYSQRRGGPRNVYRIYKCAQSLYDRSRKHASIVQATADELLTAFLWLDLYTGKLETPGEDLTGALRDVSSRLAANAESRTHVGIVLLDVTQKSIHPQARGQLAVLDAERMNMQTERNSLLARAGEGGALAAFLAEWRSTPQGFTDTADRDAWQSRFWSVWAGVPIESKQAMIRARYRPSVRVGGRGVSRIIMNPIDPTGFGQPIEDEQQ